MSHTPKPEKGKYKGRLSTDLSAFNIQSQKRLSDKTSINIKIDDFEKTDVSNNDVYAQLETSRNQRSTRDAL
ncbi:MAG: hypothetical protein FJX80_15445 [Bacteroidetes bacterium]|nr:hypothetical protein [Bacteroidota bacterium]